MKHLMTVIAAGALWCLNAGETRYLANSGNDAADGKTPATAWRTVGKLNASLPAGGTALFRRGDTFYGGVNVPGGLDADHPTTLAAWGEGPKPVISALKNLRNDPSVWEPVSEGLGIWRTCLTNEANYTGLVCGDANPGFLLVDGTVKPCRKFSWHDVMRRWDFTGEKGWLYVYNTNNPARVSQDIRVSVNVHCVILRSHMRIRDLSVFGTGAHGMQGGWNTTLEDIRIEDCDFENIGGSELLGYNPLVRVRYGNGVEFGDGCDDALVARCTFRGTYDVAFTMQGVPRRTGKGHGWRNVVCRDCLMEDCSQAFEIWCKRAPAGLGFQKCAFVNNRTRRVGGGWGAAVRPDRRGATPLLVYSMETDTVDVDVSGNVFEDAPLGLIHKSGGRDKLPRGYRISGNVCRRVAGEADTKTERPPRRGEWFDEARYGVFIHFGAYAVAGRGEWVKNRERIPNDEYAETYCRPFRIEKLDCADWARKFKKWGFKYAVLTARHHDGYAMWDSKVNPFNCVKVGGAPDVVGEYVKHMRAAGLKVGLYYSPANWSHPDYPGAFFRDWPDEKDWRDDASRLRFVAYYRAELKELLDNYGPVDYLWFDGCGPEDLCGVETLAWLRRDYPAMMVNNRLACGYDIMVCEQAINPPRDPEQRWESCMTLNDNWGYHAGDAHWKDPQDVIRLLGKCAASGGNLLLNVGPKPDGTIPEESCRILDTVGEWLAANRAAIALSERHPFGWNVTASPITVRGNKVYLHFIARPPETFTWAELGNRCIAAKWLDDGTPVAFEQKGPRLFLKGLVWKGPCRVLELTLDGAPKAAVSQTTFWIPH